MRPFIYERSASVADALASLGPDRLAYAGGTDLLTRMKLGITVPAHVVDVKVLALPRGIEHEQDGLRLGALTTLADIERAALPGWCALLPEAAAQAATPQIRERATLGGNLLQRPRCWYCRDPEVACWLKGGDACPARIGRHEHHAIFDESPCIAVHPSDLAACLVAANATVRVRGADEVRDVALDVLLAPPTDAARVEHRVGDAELIESVHVPAPADGAGTSLYLKAMDRKVWAFALVGLAASAAVERGRFTRLSLVASGVANVPHRIDASALIDAELTGARIDDLVRSVTAHAEPLAGNAYKADLLGRLVRDAVRRLTGDER